MSLRVWLPLNGNLNNQGLNNTIVVAGTNTTFETNGKIGKCLASTGSTGNNVQITISNLETILASGNAYSVCLWVKLTNAVTSSYILKIGDVPGGLWWTNVVSSSNTHRYVWNEGDSGKVLTKGDVSIDYDHWHHICVVIDKTELGYVKETYYIDGELTSGTGVTNPFRFSSSGLTTLTGTNIIIYPSVAKINDFRIYDHALSAMEVKQISQGLILHYLLNAKNLFNYHTTIYAKSFAPSGNIQDTSGWAISDYIPIFPNQSYLGVGLSAGGSNTYAVLYDVNKNKTRTILEVANQNLIVNSNQNEYYIRLSIRDFNHELTTTAKFLENNDIQYDCSGYKNNGIKEGTFTYTSDTPKYSVSSTFNGSNYIEAEPLPDETKTISVWVNYQTLPTGSDYSGFIMFDKSTQISICVYSGGQYLITYIGSSKGGTGSRVITSFQVNKWYHIVVLKTGATTREVYINGVKATPSGTNYWSGDLNKLLIGTRHAAGVYKEGANAKICDFRAYVTLLSEQEILSLYHNEAYIDNNGNIYGAMYEEE